jgi:hypothetical protein
MDLHGIDQAEHRRDRRLRKRVLQVLNAARVRPEYGWAGGRFVYDVIDATLPGGQRFESDEHLLGLMRDLVAAGYVEERDDRTRDWQRPGLDVISYRITNHGTALVHEAIDPDPLVEDDRVRPGGSRRTGRAGAGDE